MSLIKGISELVLVVKDVAASAKFYHEIVGLNFEFEPTEEWAWFRFEQPNNTQRLALRKGSLLYEEYSPNPKNERWGQVHFALEIGSNDLEAEIERIKQCGVEVYGPKYFKWMKATSYYFYDLDGNLIEFWSPE